MKQLLSLSNSLPECSNMWTDIKIEKDFLFCVWSFWFWVQDLGWHPADVWISRGTCLHFLLGLCLKSSLERNDRKNPKPSLDMEIRNFLCPCHLVECSQMIIWIARSTELCFPFLKMRWPCLIFRWSPVEPLDFELVETMGGWMKVCGVSIFWFHKSQPYINTAEWFIDNSGCQSAPFERVSNNSIVS